jgi:hypothetical protein
MNSVCNQQISKIVQNADTGVATSTAASHGTYRYALENHLHRNESLARSVVISETWYKTPI